MRVWIITYYLPHLAFVIPPIQDDIDTTIVLHLYLPMGYVNSARIFVAPVKQWRILPIRYGLLPSLTPCIPSSQCQTAPHLQMMTPTRTSYCLPWMSPVPQSMHASCQIFMPSSSATVCTARVLFLKFVGKMKPGDFCLMCM